MVILISIIVFSMKVGGFMVNRKVLGNSKVGRRFQITIPKNVRDTFPFKEGDLVLFIEEDGKLILTKSAI